MLDNSPNVKYSVILWTVQNLKVGNTYSISVVKYSILHTFLTSCLRKLVRVCLAVIHWLLSVIVYLNMWIKIFYVKISVNASFFCSCSYLFTFLLSWQFYIHIYSHKLQLQNNKLEKNKGKRDTQCVKKTQPLKCILHIHNRSAR